MNKTLRTVLITSTLLVPFSIPYTLSPVPCSVAAAKEFALSANVDRNVVGVDEQVHLQIDVNGSGNVSDPQIPDLQNFAVYPAGKSSSFSIVNGSMSSAVSFRYTLAPRTVGKFTIPPITVHHDGRAYQTQPIQIEVTQAGGAGKGQASSRQPTAAPAQKAKGVFVTATLDKTTARVNEQLVYTFRFCRRIDVGNAQYSAPNFSGFWAEELGQKNYSTTIDGEQYMVSEVRTMLFPTQAGKLTLNAARVQCLVADTSADQDDDLFAGFFTRTKPLQLQANPITVNVLPLPEAGKPADFNGMVGRFKVSAALDRRSVKANEAVTLTVTVSGTGNIKTIADPKLPDWPDFRKYETAGTLNLDKNDGTMKGSKVFKTIIVPTTPGRKTIPSLSFSFFDPATNGYHTERTAPLTLEVAPAAPGSVPPPVVAAPSAPSAPQAQSEAVKVVNRDINYIKTLSDWRTAGRPLYATPWFIFLNALPLLLLAGTFGWIKWQEKLSGDVAFARRIKASGTARKYLKKAKTLLAVEHSRDYYGAVARALLEFIAHKLNVSPDGLTFAALQELLTARQVPTETVGKIKAVLDECDLVRFAPTQATAAMMQATYAAAEEVIGRLEKELK